MSLVKNPIVKVGRRGKKESKIYLSYLSDSGGYRGTCTDSAAYLYNRFSFNGKTTNLFLKCDTI